MSLPGRMTDGDKAVYFSLPKWARPVYPPVPVRVFEMDLRDWALVISGSVLEQKPKSYDHAQLQMVKRTSVGEELFVVGVGYDPDWYMKPVFKGDTPLGCEREWEKS